MAHGQKKVRVGAFLEHDYSTDTIKFLGYGTFVGEDIPREAVGIMGEMLTKNGIANPKIVLDSGQVVYGCECWWDDEHHIKKRLEKATTVVAVDIDKVRQNYREEQQRDKDRKKES